MAFLRVLSVALAFLAAPALLAQQPQEAGANQPNTAGSMATRTISGSVVVPGTIVGGILVTLESENRSYHRFLHADGAGNFSFGSVPAGQYWITIEAEGYRTLRERLEVPRGSGVITVQYLMRAAPSQTTPGSSEPSVSVVAMKVPERARRQYQSAQRAMRENHPGKAREHLQRALQMHAQFPDALVGLATLDLYEEHLDSALSHIRACLKIEPTHPAARVLLLRILNGLGRHEEALEAAAPWLPAPPAEWQIYFELGVAGLATGRDGVVRDCIERILSAGIENLAEPHLLQAGLFLRSNAHRDAAAELKIFLAHAPPNHRHARLAREILARLETPDPHD